MNRTATRPARRVEALERRQLLAAELDLATDAPAEIWTAVDRIPAARDGLISHLRVDDFATYTLDDAGLAAILATPAARGTDDATAVLSLPTPDGKRQRFAVTESSIMAPVLAARFPEIRTFSGRGIDDPAATVHFDTTPAGFHAQVLTTHGSYYVDPYYHLDDSLYASYYLASVTPGDFVEHGVEEHDHNDHEEEHDHDHNHHEHDHHDEPPASARRTALPRSGAQLRTYRTAVAATGEYTAFHGGTVADAQAAIVTAINRVSGIYQHELSIALELVAGNDSLVYTDAATDPYTNDDAFAVLGENQTNVDAVIGTGNYDVGHVFTTNGGGLAYLSVVGFDPFKAGGTTGLSRPTGDAFYVDLVSHEFGHQFGGNHTFNGDSGSCSGQNRNGSTAYEPGSGSTIQAYAGICGNDDLQNRTDAYFHSVSFDEMINYVDNIVPTVGTRTVTGNSVPNVSAGPDYTIPAGTPFGLVADASDADGDALTYSWEQRDLGPQRDVNAGDDGVGPLFRAFAPTPDPVRIFPRLADVLDGTTIVGETLPTTTRELNFRVTARDNRPDGGGVDTDDVRINVVDTGTAFAVTSPNTAVTWTPGSTQTITWDVAGTDAGDIAAATVDIDLSTDGGLTYPIVLAAGVANDGTQTVTVPNLTTTTARVRVRPTGNIFFDVSDVDFGIGAAPPVTNDDFADRIDLTGQTSTVGNNDGFTSEPGEPLQNGTINSAWWSWTAPADGTLTVDTNGSDFDTYLTVATGASVDTLTVLDQDDDAGLGLQSLITLPVTAGVQYQIAVDGFSGNTGDIVLNLNLDGGIEVNNTNDAGPGSLRQAILDANASPTVDVITFDIPGGGVKTIDLQTELPAITDAVTIDGGSEPDYAGAPVVRLSGSDLASATDDGLTVSGATVTIRGLEITDFPGTGIQYVGTDGGQILASVITDNARHGVNAIDTTFLEIIDNTITGNGITGVQLQATGGPVGPELGRDDVPTAAIEDFGFSSDNLIADNVVTGNTVAGVRVQSPFNQISDNVLSGNGESGLVISGASASDNFVEGNRIGVDAAGTTAVPNGIHGILLTGSSNAIGGPSPDQRNIISGNGRDGIFISGIDASDNDILGNHIGVDAAGTAAIPNGLTGIWVAGAPFNFIGGSNPGDGNVISGNGRVGIQIVGPDATANSVEGNFIGTDAAGETAIPNAETGLLIFKSAANSVGPAGGPDGRNVISGNGSFGVLIFGVGADNNNVFFNHIGLDADGDSPLGNGRSGVDIRQGAAGNAVFENFVAANGTHQIAIRNSVSTDNGVTSNTIGLARDGVTRIDGGSTGVYVNAPSNRITANAITGSSVGVFLTGTRANDTTVRDNDIGTTDDPSAPDYGMFRGVVVTDNAFDNTIGPNNRIAYSTNRAIALSGAGTGNRITENSVFGNARGITLTSATTLPNDPGDADEGPNRLQNNATSLGVTLTPTGTGDDVRVDFQYRVDTLAANAAYPLTVEFFLSDATGQGVAYLAADTYTAGGLKQFTEVVDPSVFPFAPRFGTATVTDADGNTSEFSAPVAIVDNTPANSPLAAAPPAPSAMPIPGDVNGDRVITPLDALMVLNHLRSTGTAGSTAAAARPAAIDPAMDLNGDGRITPLDALTILNTLRRETTPAPTRARDTYFADLTDDEDNDIDLYLRDLNARVVGV